MQRSLTRGVLAVVFAAAAAIAGPAASAAAAVDQGDHGAQAQCRYVSEDVPGREAMRLKRITVQPPTLFSVNTPRQVGWRVIVERSYDEGTFKRIFISTIQRGDATPTSAASLSPISALIDSPVFIPDGHGGFRHADYRVILKFYRFTQGGSISRVERNRVAAYDTFRDGAFQWTDSGMCAHSWLFDD